MNRNIKTKTRNVIGLMVVLGLLVGCNEQTDKDGRPVEIKASSWVTVKQNDLNKVQTLFPDGDIKKMIDNYWVIRRPDGSVWYAYTGDWVSVTTNILFGPIVVEDRVKL